MSKKKTFVGLNHRDLGDYLLLKHNLSYLIDTDKRSSIAIIGARGTKIIFPK